MSWRGIHVSSAARLSLHQSQVLLEGEENELSVPLEDLAYIVLDTPRATLTAALLAACAEAGCLLITTDARHMPNGALLPFHAFYRQAETMQAQINLGEPRKKRLWQAIIRAKISNQAACLRLLGAEESRVRRVQVCIDKVHSGDPQNVEGTAARLYWSCYSRDFARDTDGSDRLNAMLNYAYALLRAVIGRELAALGFAPCLGIHHRSQGNAFNLADDCIEPWRPFADHAVMHLWRKDPEKEALDTNDRQSLTGLLHAQCVYAEGEQTLTSALRAYVSGIRACVVHHAPEPCFPVLCAKDTPHAS